MPRTDEARLLMLLWVLAAVGCDAGADPHREMQGSGDLAGVCLASIEARDGPGGCELHLEPVATLGAVEDPAARTGINQVARSSDGGFYAAPFFQGPQVVRYNADGSFHSIHARRGQGPGEMSSEPRSLMTRGDSLFVVEDRLHLFDEGFEPRLSAPLPIFGHRNGLLVDGTVVSSFPLQREDGNTYMIHLARLGDQGALNVVHSVHPIPGGEGIPPVSAVASPTDDGGFWVTLANRSILDRYDGSGQHLRTVEINRSWFVPWDVRPPRDGIDSPPVPRTLRVRELDNGWILVSTVVPSDGWEPLERSPALGSTDRAGQDTMLELVDPVNGAVLASLRVPWLLDLVAGPGVPLVHAAETMPSGDVSIHVWRVAIR